MCKEIPIEITTPDNLTFLANQNMLLDFEGKDNLTKIVEFTFTEQTTIKLLFHATCIPTGKRITEIFYFVPQNDNLIVTRSGKTYNQTIEVESFYQEPIWDTSYNEIYSLTCCPSIRGRVNSILMSGE